MLLISQAAAAEFPIDQANEWDLRSLVIHPCSVKDPHLLFLAFCLIWELIGHWCIFRSLLVLIHCSQHACCCCSPGGSLGHSGASGGPLWGLQGCSADGSLKTVLEGLGRGRRRLFTGFQLDGLTRLIGLLVEDNDDPTGRLEK